jgi:NAD-dependent SIR2 family protein deacetylase
MITREYRERCSDLLRDADRVLIGAGSGLSVDAGIDYMDKVSFARRFPGLVKKGFRMKAELMGYTGWSPELQWGYLSVHVNDVRFQAPEHPVYGQLLDLVSQKDYFVMTSNVDGMFVKNGFAQDRVFTPQGDYALMQCLAPCRNATWATKPIIDPIIPTVDPDSQEVTDPGVIPSCPYCGGPVFMNVRGGHWFLEEPYEEQAKRFSSWVNGSSESRLLVLEIGAGFNTPGVIRWPMERIVSTHPHADLIRVNLHWPEVPKEIQCKAISLQCTAMSFISDMWQEMRDPTERSVDSP